MTVVFELTFTISLGLYFSYNLHSQPNIKVCMHTLVSFLMLKHLKISDMLLIEEISTFIYNIYQITYKYSYI